MKVNQLLLGSLALMASDLVLAGRVVGARVGTPVSWEDGGMLALIAGGLAFGIWVVRRKNK